MKVTNYLENQKLAPNKSNKYDSKNEYAYTYKSYSKNLEILHITHSNIFVK